MKRVVKASWIEDHMEELEDEFYGWDDSEIIKVDEALVGAGFHRKVNDTYYQEFDDSNINGDGGKYVITFGVHPEMSTVSVSVKDVDNPVRHDSDYEEYEEPTIREAFLKAVHDADYWGMPETTCEIIRTYMDA